METIHAWLCKSWEEMESDFATGNVESDLIWLDGCCSDNVYVHLFNKHLLSIFYVHCSRYKGYISEENVQWHQPSLNLFYIREYRVNNKQISKLYSMSTAYKCEGEKNL